MQDVCGCRHFPGSFACSESLVKMRAWSAMTMLIGVAMFIVVVLILHLIQSGYETRHQLISELALGQLRYTNGYCTKACRRVLATLAWNCRMEALPTMNRLVSESATCSQRMKVSRCHTTTVDPWHVWIVRYNCSMPSHIPGFG